MPKPIRHWATQNPLYRMFNAFFQLESSGGIILVGCAILALLWANLSTESYAAFWKQSFQLSLGNLKFGLTLHEWINDGLMAIFFLVVGLEIKREFLIGELSNPKQAALPILSAIGGMAAPVLIFILFNPPGSEYHQGWGVPTVTDIAFSIGVLALLGQRVPFGLKVFLVALAIADDIGAVLLIALFYSGHIDLNALFIVGGIFIATLGFRWIGLSNALFYYLSGIAMWAFLLHSGIHASLAGILLAVTIPSKSKIEPHPFFNRAQHLLAQFQQAGLEETALLPTNAHLDSVKSLEVLCEKIVSPLHSMERALHPWSTYLILPLFALANAGIVLAGGHIASIWQNNLSLGIIAGLVFGKQIGVLGFSWIAVTCRIAHLPAGVTWWQLHAVSWLTGIGFTMSIFISNLAFPNPEILAIAKTSIFVASILASLIGLLSVWLSIRHNPLETFPEEI